MLTLREVAHSCSNVDVASQPALGAASLQADSYFNSLYNM